MWRPRPKDGDAPTEEALVPAPQTQGRVVDSAVYVDGKRIGLPGHPGRDLPLPAGDRGRHGVDRPLPARPEPSSPRWPPSSTSTSWPSRTPSPPTSGRSWSATATPCSSCCAPARYLDDERGGRVRRGPRVRRARLRAHRAPQRGPQPGRRAPAHGGRPRPAAASGPRPCSTPSSTRWSTATRRWSPASRTTSRRSRPRSSAATRRCPAASTS